VISIIGIILMSRVSNLAKKKAKISSAAVAAEPALQEMP